MPNVLDDDQIYTDSTLSGIGTEDDPLKVYPPFITGIAHDSSVQGNGTSGSPLSISIQVDGTLQGSGTQGSPLSVKNVPMPSVAQTYTPSVSGTATLDLSLSNQHYVTFPAGNITIALSNISNNQIFMVTLTQDAVGGRTVTWFGTIKWVAGSIPTLTVTGSKRDTFGFIRTGVGTYDGFIIGANI